MEKSIQQNSGIALSDAQRLDWLRLTRTSGIGPRTFKALINRFGSAAEALNALPELLKSQGRVAQIASRAEAEAEMALAVRFGVRFIGMGEPDYPHLLRMTEACPPVIALRGDAKVFSRPSVAMVGSRNSSAAGLKLATHFATVLGQHHYLIISGLARGIDAAAHRASLETGTVAVLAGGQDQIYPPEHRDLLNSILENGAAISEMPMGWEPRGRDFPRRNRIISGLSHGTLLIEAALRSGSLITARFAAEQGRDVFAVPGSPLDPRAEGANDLIRNGATLVTAPEHVIEALAPIFGRTEWPPGALESAAVQAEPLWDELDLFAETVPLLMREDLQALGTSLHSDLRSSSSFEQRKDELFSLMGPSPISVDDLIRVSGLPARLVQVLLLELELRGDVTRHGAGLVSAAPSRFQPRA